MNVSSPIGHNSKRTAPVFAITFDLDTTGLKQSYHNASWQNAYMDVGAALRQHGFERMQGYVYFGNDGVDAATCVLAVQQLTSDLPWFALAVKDIRMLRIEDNNDLMPAVERVMRPRK